MTQSQDESPLSKDRWNAFKITTIYMVIGGLWFLFANELLLALFQDVLDLDGRHGFRFWIYFSVSGIGLYLLILSYLNIIRRKEHDLKEKEQKIRTFYESVSCGIIVHDQSGSVIHANEVACNIIGLNLEQLLGKVLYEKWQFIQEDGTPFSINTLPTTITLQTGMVVRNTVMGMLHPKDREYRWLLVHSNPVFDPRTGLVKQSVTTFVDITERKEAEDHLRLSNTVFETTLEAIVVTDASATIQKVNPAFSAMTGYEVSEVIGKTPRVLSSQFQNHTFYEDMWESLLESGHWRGEIWNRRKNGELFLELKTIVAVKDQQDNTVQYVAVSHDITDYKRKVEQINHLAYHDALTGLPNRHLFHDRLIQSLAHAHLHQESLAILFIDMDRFKNVNDSLGHNIGDELLKKIARRLEECIREGDTLARLGGDEFIVLLPTVFLQQVERIARRILEEMKAPFIIDGFELFISASIGVSMYPNDGIDQDTLIKNADTAMYQAKELGKNTYQFYTLAMSTQSFAKLEMESYLRKAIERNELVVYYQPQIDLMNQQLIGMEALVRWKHPKLGMVSPGKFIPLAEETGLIVPVGEWVLRTACKQAKQWHDQGIWPLKMSVNMSVRQFQQQNIVALVAAVLEDTKISPSSLELEITESILQNIDMIMPQLEKLKKLGVQISIDDFGTGYSSLNYLKNFPVDTLKIDQSFIRDIYCDPRNATIVMTIIAMAQTLQMNVIAEGVETEEQLRFLIQQQCDGAQGYYFSPPIPAEEIWTRFPDMRRPVSR